ncbi:caspase family protein [Tsuneonella sp. HG249]
MFAIITLWRSLLILTATVALVTSQTPAAAAAAPRIALVVGNADYEAITDLSNPLNDARLVRQTLEGLGFEVLYRENADRDSMERVISAFGQRLHNAGPSAVGLFYYAGHAVQSNGENYLLPTDVEARRESDLRFGAIRTSDLMAQMESSGVSNKIVILDACRTSPYTTSFGKSGSSGLSQIGLGNSEFFVAFAATAGNIADDGNAENSPYALALAKYLPFPDSEISNTFRLVRNEVSASTKQRQLPEIRSTLRQQFYFAGGSPALAQPDLGPPTGEAEVRMAAVNQESILGKWCTPGRSMGLQLEISANKIRYQLGREGTVFDIKGIRVSPDGTILVDWNKMGDTVTFEFGDFSASGKLMTQMRGKNEGDEDWKEYNLRLRRC